MFGGIGFVNGMLEAYMNKTNGLNSENVGYAFLIQSSSFTIFTFISGMV